MQVNCIVIHATKSSNMCINITFFINMLYARYVDVIKNQIFTGHDERSRSSGSHGTNVQVLEGPIILSIRMRDFDMIL